MKDWNEKVDNSPTISGTLYMDDINSNLSEKKNVVRPFMTFDKSNNRQMLYSIEQLSKSIHYRDIGTVNQIVLSRDIKKDGLDSYADGMVLFFSPSTANTGSVTLTVNGLSPKSLITNGLPVEAGALNPALKYMAIYMAETDTFELVRLTTILNKFEGGDPNYTYLASDGVLPDDAVTRQQLDTKMFRYDLVNNLYSHSVDKPLAANQLRVLKYLYDSTVAKKVSNDTNLDTIQEIVDYIKVNRSQLNAIAINNVVGLQSALDNKLDVNPAHNHNGLYYLKNEVDTLLNGLAITTGDASRTFKVADGIAPNDAVNHSQIGLIPIHTGWNYKEPTDPASNTNPQGVGSAWLNTTSGEIFVCTNSTANNNTWVGSDDSTPVVVIPPPPVPTVPPLEEDTTNVLNDNSCLAVFNFEQTMQDDRGWYSPINSSTSGYNATAKFGSYSIGLLSGYSYIKYGMSPTVIRAISFWYSNTSTSTQGNYLLDYTSNGTHFSLIYHPNNNTISVGYEMTVYVDGVQVSNGATVGNGSNYMHIVVSYSNAVNATWMNIGNDSELGSSDKVAGGRIDRLRIYDRELTPSDVQTLYNET